MLNKYKIAANTFIEYIGVQLESKEVKFAEVSPGDVVQVAPEKNKCEIQSYS